MREEIVIPCAPILVESTRSIGYSFESALADIIDNSISKGANAIHVYFDSNQPQYIAVIDDACGMNEKELVAAMRYGSRNATDVRDETDLGRFGLGMKTASLSQCRKLTVITKQNDSFCAAQWDLDHIIQQKDWALKCFIDTDEIRNIKFAKDLEKQNSGTVVLWENFDRMLNGAINEKKVFDEKIEVAREHIALVFHRFMGEKNPARRLKIFFNGVKVEPVDAFLTTHPATQPLTEQTLLIDSKRIFVKPYILPYYSKLNSKDRQYLGDPADLRQKQGFYIYRNKRLIIWGTWFRLIKHNELNKLARIRVDIPNSLDSIWEIDIKKSRASLPDIVKRNLISIVEKAVGRSERVYKYRGRQVSDDNMQHTWKIINNRGRIQYQVNRELSLYKKLESCLDEDGIQYLDSLLKVVEDAFPYEDVYYRRAKSEENAQPPNLDFTEVYQVATDMITSIRSMHGDVDAFLASIDKFDFFTKYPNVISKIREDYTSDK